MKAELKQDSYSIEKFTKKSLLPVSMKDCAARFTLLAFYLLFMFICILANRIRVSKEQSRRVALVTSN